MELNDKRGVKLIKRILKGLLPFVILIAILEVPDLIASQDIFDNNTFSQPIKLTYEKLNSKNSSTSDDSSNAWELSNTSEISEIIKQLSTGKYRRTGVISLIPNLPYPKFIIIPEYNNKRQDNIYLCEISENGRVQFMWRGQKYRGEIAKGSLQIIEGILKNNK